MKKLFTLVFFVSFFSYKYLWAQKTLHASVVARHSTVTSNSFYFGNKEPLQPLYLIKLPVGVIKPEGWILKYLQLQRDGLTGHLGEISGWLDKNNNAWFSGNGKGDNGWEEVPYWLKGYGDLGYGLKDEKIIANARRWIDGVLSSQQPDGYFGPIANKTSLDKPHGGGDGFPDLWPHMDMLNVLQSFHEATGDPRVIPFMTRYMKWLDTLPPQTFSRGYWPRNRFGDNIESIYWLYNRTGDAFLLP